MAYVYRHIRHDTNQPFYIGVGLTNDNYFRAYQKSKTKRSSYWHNISKNGYDVEILFDNITNEQALEKEKEFIKLYGRSDNNTGILCNLTDGGENPPIMYGENNPMKRKYSRDKLSKSMTGRKLSIEHRENLKISKINTIPPSRKGCNMEKHSIEKMVESRLRNGKRRKVIYQYSLDGVLINTWSYAKEIKSVHSNFSTGNIQSVCRGERDSAYGFVWSYKQLAGLTRRRKAEADLYFKPVA